MTDKQVLRKDNNFGALRLLFASVVILSHSPEILDGHRDREILTSIFGTVSFGGLGVDGFFIISGYLITKSFLSSDTLIDYFKKRVLRIYPGFIVNFWLCVFALAPFVGAGLSVFQRHAVAFNIARMLLLAEPAAPGAFSNMPYPALNGSMWTIAYEFRCYLLVALLGSVGAFNGRFRYVLLAGVLGCLIVNGLGVARETVGVAPILLGSPSQNFHLFGVFGAGMLFFLFERNVVYDDRFALSAAAALLVCLFFESIAVLAIAVFGAYLIFWFGFRYKVLSISLFANKTDLSYGIYLYAWPVQATIAYFNRSINPWTLSIVTLFLSSAAAYVSWTFVEKRALTLAHRPTPKWRRVVEPQ